MPVNSSENCTLIQFLFVLFHTFVLSSFTTIIFVRQNFSSLCLQVRSYNRVGILNKVGIFSQSSLLGKTVPVLQPVVSLASRLLHFHDGWRGRETIMLRGHSGWRRHRDHHRRRRGVVQHVVGQLHVILQPRNCHLTVSRNNFGSLGDGLAIVIMAVRRTVVQNYKQKETISTNHLTLLEWTHQVSRVEAARYGGGRGCKWPRPRTSS